MKPKLGRMQECEDKLSEHAVMFKGTNKLAREISSAKVDDSENGSHLNNIVIYGMKEGKKEQNEYLEQRIMEGIFEDTLKVDVKS